MLTTPKRTETPNAVMTTLASPQVGGAGHSLWRISMAGGHAGPEHVLTEEQVLTVLSGEAVVATAEGETVVGPGQTVVIPAGAVRRVSAPHGFEAISTANPTVRVLMPDGEDRGVLPWAG